MNKAINNIKLSKRIIAVITILLLTATSLLGLSTSRVFATTDDSKIVIVHTNDVHCNIGDKDGKSIKYENVAGIVDDLKTQYSNVSLVDSGDNLQGGPSGLFSKGSSPLGIMNKTNYVYSAVGNHDFDYGVARLLEVAKDTSNKVKYLSCNFKNIDGSNVFDSYVVEEYTVSGGSKVRVAYVGVTTPETLSKTPGDTFKDKDGKYIYTFCEDADGTALYNCVQAAVDDARNPSKGDADYVILLAHLGQTGVEDRWRSDTLVKKTNGIDAVLDAHSHEVYNQKVKNKDGKEIPLTQSGLNMSRVGILTIDTSNGAITEEQKAYSQDMPKNTDVETYVDAVRTDISGRLAEKIGVSTVELRAFEDDAYTWAVRVRETNMGDFVTDAYRYQLGADVSIINSGGIRNDIKQGDITFGNVIKVQPFGNDTVVVKATGQQILDALEMGARKYPEPYAAFMQVSGITYDIMTNVPSSVIVDEKGTFVGVNGEYRVQNVKINGQPLDLNKKYTVGGLNFTLVRQGDGLAMFNGCEVVKFGPTDYQVISSYIKDTLGGTIGSEYSNISGQGRINITEKKAVKPADVDTGDESNPEVFLILLIISIGACSFFKRKIV